MKKFTISICKMVLILLRPILLVPPEFPWPIITWKIWYLNLILKPRKLPEDARMNSQKEIPPGLVLLRVLLDPQLKQLHFPLTSIIPDFVLLITINLWPIIMSRQSIWWKEGLIFCSWKQFLILSTVRPHFLLLQIILKKKKGFLFQSWSQEQSLMPREELCLVRPLNPFFTQSLTTLYSPLVLTVPWVQNSCALILRSLQKNLLFTSRFIPTLVYPMNSVNMMKPLSTWPEHSPSGLKING